MFELAGYQSPILVSSVDGVGTKVKVAIALDRHDTIGIDLVNHCVNDILTCKAKPLFFLDYLALGKLVPEQVESIVSGLAQACREVGLALIGGETAEMPGLYAEGDYDLAGFIVGIVERNNIPNKNVISAGDVLIGLASSGLHTNGYSLVRRIFDIGSDRMEARRRLEVYYQELGRTLGEELLTPHRCYLRPLEPLLPHIKGLAHITGGGLIDNVPRALPEGVAARFHRGAWEGPAVFSLIQKQGGVADDEMYRVFNMGLGMVLVCDRNKAPAVHQALADTSVPAYIVGEITERVGGKGVILS